MNSCNSPNCQECEVHGKYCEETFKRMMTLVIRTLRENDLDVPSPRKQPYIMPCFKVKKNQTQEILLNPAMTSYLHKSTSKLYQSIQNNQLVSKLYIGPCGILSIFAARDDFDSSGVGIERDMVTCKYKTDGPESQQLFIVCIPLRICACCHRGLCKSYKCSRCREVGVHARYCSRACQVQHWPVHKAVCGGKLEREARLL